jgi:hypothetical protein
MHGLGQELLAGRRRALGAAVLIGAMVSAVPAGAQEFLGGLLRLFAPPVARAPFYEPSYYNRPLPSYEHRAVRRRPKVAVARVSEPVAKPSLKPSAPGEPTNPFPALLSDPTLRRGDIVMFPDGPRIFTGQHGTQHALDDFEPVSARSAPSISPSVRKLASALRPGLNDAWSSAPEAKLAATTKDIEATGGVRRPRR